MKIVCEICGKVVDAYRSTRKTCSKECDNKRRNMNRSSSVKDGAKECSICKHIKPISEFYKHNRYDAYRPYCKQCDNDMVLERQKSRKRHFVELKGGKCIRCGYDKCISALEFHHQDPKEKDFNINRNYSLEKMESELNKCDLLCANCHREVHADLG